MEDRGTEYVGFNFIEGPADFLISWVLPAVVVIWFWVSRGQTPGKMAIGAKVVDAESGELVSVGQGILRYVGYFVSAIVLLLGYIWVGIDARKRGWHDFIGRTVVVRK